MFLLLAESIIDPQKINLSLKIALDRITVDWNSKTICSRCFALPASGTWSCPRRCLARLLSLTLPVPVYSWSRIFNMKYSLIVSLVSFGGNVSRGGRRAAPSLVASRR
jgi:hypothetical protein